MQLVKGFITLDRYINNTPGEIAPLGEFDKWCMSFCREMGINTNTSFPDMTLYSTKSIDIDSGESIKVSDTIATLLFEITKS